MDYPSLKKRSPLTIENKIDKDNETTKKLTITLVNGDQHKHTLPVNEFNNPEHTIYCISEYNELADTYTFDADDHFQYFRQTLSLAPRQLWDDIANGVNHTIANFENARNQLLRQTFTNEAFYNFLDYIQAYRKPKHMKARVLYSRLRVLFSYSQFLPNSAPIDNRNQKRYYLQTFPQKYQQEFNRQHRNVENVTFIEMAEYFQTFDEDFIDMKPKRKGNNNYSGPNKSRNRFDTRSNNSSMCRLHSHLGNKNHKWSDCVYNPRSQNYNASADERRKSNPQRSINQSGRAPYSNGSSGNRSTQPQGHTHYNQRTGNHPACPTSNHVNIVDSQGSHASSLTHSPSK